MKHLHIIFEFVFISILLCSCANKTTVDTSLKYKTVSEAVKAGDCLAVKERILKAPNLADEGDPYNEYNFTPLTYAIALRSDVEKNPSPGKNAKMYEDMVKMLIDMKAGINTPLKKDGETPITLAAARGQTDTVVLLLEKGIDIESKGTAGWTPLHQAVLGNHKDMVEFLINKGAQVNTKDANWGTPLLSAVAYDFKDIAELLINKGADVNSVDIFNKTPLDYAILKNNKDMGKWLRSKGGKEKTPGPPDPAIAQKNLKKDK